MNSDHFRVHLCFDLYDWVDEDNSKKVDKNCDEFKQVVRKFIFKIKIIQLIIKVNANVKQK